MVFVHLLAFLGAVYYAAWQAWQHFVLQVAGHSVGLAGKGAARCLRTALDLLGGSGGTTAADQHPLGYAAAAAAGIAATVSTAFHNKSYWTAVALLDVSSLWAVLRRHKTAHAEAATAASVRRAAADPSDPATTVREPSTQNLPLLKCAAVHSKAAYGAPAASGYLASAVGYASLLTLHQATHKAPRRIPAARHLSAVHELTGCPPSDVLASQWQSHLHRPAFYVAIDRQQRCVVISVRGTLQLGDFMSVLDAVPQPATLCGVSGHVHGGMLLAARNLLPPVLAALRSAAQLCPGWEVLLTGHSLGGGVAALLALMLLEKRQALAGSHDQQQQVAELEEEQDDANDEAAAALLQLGSIRCVGIGAAAACCQLLGAACRDCVTSVLFGYDCLPMFSVLGARLLIEEVHSCSKAAAAVASLMCRLPGSSRAGSGSNQPTSSSSNYGSSSWCSSWGLGRTASTASSVASSLSCDVACGSSGCRGLCASSAAADSALEIEEATLAAAAAAASATSATRGLPNANRLERCSSAWSTASTSSIAAFAAECCGGGGDGLFGSRQVGGEALIPMFPPGRLLWLLPASSHGSSAEQPWLQWLLQQLRQSSAEQALPAGAVMMVETDQSAFERFLLTLETASHHLPDGYIAALASLAH